MTPDESEPTARVLADAHRGDAAPTGGAWWTLAESGRQLDANLVHLPPGRHVPGHVEPDLDVLLLVVEGAGTIGLPPAANEVAEGSLVWLPHGSRREITAGPNGLSYLTVHRRRPGMQIKRRPDPTPN